MRPFFALLTLGFLCLLPLHFGAQGSDLFPPARLGELREEVVYEAPEKRPEPEGSPFEFDWEPYRRPLLIAASVLLAAGLGLLIYLILGNLRASRKSPARGPSAAVERSEIVEEELVMHGVDASLLARAEASGQYDIAVRLHYIGLLKVLRDAEAIQYRPDYSNRDYLRQLAGSPLREAFHAVTGAYERFWYGQYRIDRLSYRLTVRDFDELRARIGPSSPQRLPS